MNPARWLISWWRDYEDWRVVYHDGQRTYRMKRHSAKNMQAIFGGQIVYDPVL